MRKILIFIILIAGLLIGGFYLLNNQLSRNDNIEQAVTADRFVTSDDIQWYQDPDQQFNLAIFHKPFTLTFTAENAQTLKEQSFLAGYSLAVNGTYFRGSYVQSEHSGLLQIEGKKYWDMVPDKQLTHIAVYDESADRLEFIPTSEYVESNYQDSKYTLFQTGPLLIEAGVKQDAFINNSPNGNGRFLRTMLGVTNTGDKFVMISRVNNTLNEIADMLLNFPVFKGKQITVINLDGGTSTAMYSKELEQYNFQESARLPLVIGVK